ncbi:hypothetical protein [Clostridium thermobutyricum]|uniref:hypothetical protein n=1 Tax=Clostridium thermobutyricum TaxID=29372 RepID=UPI0018AAF64E|nr:hypothetical protein [Clostridium thermobutyricum]
MDEIEKNKELKNLTYDMGRKISFVITKDYFNKIIKSDKSIEDKFLELVGILKHFNIYEKYSDILRDNEYLRNNFSKVLIEGFNSTDINLNRIISMTEAHEKYKIDYASIRDSIQNGFFSFKEDFRINNSEYQSFIHAKDKINKKYPNHNKEDEIEFYIRYGNMVLIDDKKFQNVFSEYIDEKFKLEYSNEDENLDFENIITSTEISKLYKIADSTVRKKIYSNSEIARKIGKIWIIKRRDSIRIFEFGNNK